MELGAKLPSFVILTREATQELAVFHNRMPVIIPRENADSWLHFSMNAMDSPVLELSYEKLVVDPNFHLNISGKYVELRI
jgi:putative SOS response-associated peptidase YedK